MKKRIFTTLLVLVAIALTAGTLAKETYAVLSSNGKTLTKLDAIYANPEYSDFTAVIPIDAIHFPDAKFRNWLLSQEYGQDGALTPTEIAGVGSMDVSNQQIADLTGIEYFTSLKNLNCRDNQLQVLDVSQNTNLTHFDCANNRLTSLNMTGCSPTASFKCFGNQLAGEYMDAFLSSLPSVTADSRPVIEVYDEAVDDHNFFTREQIAVLWQKGWTPKFWYKTASGWGNITLTSANDLPIVKCYFPDDNFRAFLLSQGSGQDHKFSALELSRMYELDVSSLQIADLTGIGYFNRLDELSCYNNQFSGEAMDALVQNLPTVTNGRLVVIDDGSATEQNTMTKEQANAASMKGWTPLTTSGKCLADYLLIDENNFPDDNFRDWLFEQSYGEDHILTVGELANITEMTIGWKDIASLMGLQYFMALQTLTVPFNQLTELTLYTLTDLQKLYIDGNQISGEAMTTLVRSLCNRHNKPYGELYAIYNTNEQNVITSEQVFMANVKNWKVYQFVEGTGWTEMEGIIDIDENNFPDENFRRYLLSQEYGSDGKLTPAEVASVYSIDVHSMNIADLQGIEFFTNLQYLQCWDNQLTWLDVLANIDLQWLDCNTNQLTYVSVDGLTSLYHFDCHYNQLTQLVISRSEQPSNIKYFDCSANYWLTRIDGLKLNPDQTEYTLICYDTAIRGVGMDNLIKCLVELGPDQQGTLKVYDETFMFPGTICTPEHVAAATAKGWRVLYLNQETLQWEDYAGFTNDIGDADSSGTIDIADANIIVDYILGKAVPTTFNVTAADVNGDLRVSIVDVTEIVQMLLPAAYDPSAAQAQLRSIIAECRAQLNNCKSDLESNDSGYNHPGLWAELERLETALDDVAANVENATTESEIKDCTSELKSIIVDLAELQADIRSTFH